MDYAEYKERSNKITSGMHAIDVPLFIKCLQLHIKLDRDFQKTGPREINSDYDRGFVSACDNIHKYLDKVAANWQ